MIPTPGPTANAPAGPLAQPTAAGYYARMRGLLLTPAAEWTAIAGEQPTTQQIFMRWVLPLTLLFFLAPQLGAIAFPAQIDGKPVSPSLASALYTTVVGTMLMVAGVWALAWLIDYFAPGFGARRDPAQAIKLAAYSGTGLWLSGLIGLAPPLILLGAVGIVSIFTLYRGLPVMMQSPPDKTLPYAAAVIGAAATMAVVLMALANCMTMFAGTPPPPKPVAPIVAPTTAPRAPANPAASLDTDKLRRLAPDAMPGGWVRTGVTRNVGGTLGFTGPTVETTYENGARRIVLRAIDLGAGGGAAPTAVLRATRPARDDPRALVRHGEDGDRYVFSETDRVSGETKLLTVVDGRIGLALEGRGVAMAELEQTLAMIDMVRVKQIANGL